ncbi:MAG TPA: hypothetical protein VGE01_05340 [Fimbriimonas sp.]
MQGKEFYERPLVRRLASIFSNSKPPEKVTEQQFDGFDNDLAATARKAWHEIDQEDYWHYLLDLAYVDLQPDLFDYLFPAFLIKWWEGLVSHYGGPASETDIYYAIDHGQVFEKMMDAGRREEIFAWMMDGYLDAVDSWSGCMNVVYESEGPNNLHGLLWSFNALGQSVPILPQIWERLTQVETPGRAQWWLVLATGLAYLPNEAPAIPPWNRGTGGGGVYLTESEASIFDHGYLPSNLEFIRSHLTLEVVERMLEASVHILSNSSEVEWARTVLDRFREEREFVQARHRRFLMLLGEPDLGGVVDDYF